MGIETRKELSPVRALRAGRFAGFAETDVRKPSVHNTELLKQLLTRKPVHALEAKVEGLKRRMPVGGMHRPLFAIGNTP